MSRLPTSGISRETSTSTPSQASKIADFGGLDARLRKLADSTLQTSPYILTVPSTRPYNVDPRQAHEWKRGTPFEDHEEQLQYLSFLPDWDNGLITPVGTWDNERGEIMDRSHSQQSVRSGNSTPSTATKKVKHSLSDYMKKTTGQTASVSNKEAKKSEDKLSNGNAASRKRDSPQVALKRPREDGEVSEPEAAQSAKKMRPSPSSTGQTKKKQEVENFDLPPPISPTLPPAIEKELAKLSSLSESEERGKIKDKRRASPLPGSKSPEKHPRPKLSDGPSKSRVNGLAQSTSTEKSDKTGHKEEAASSLNGLSRRPAPRETEPRDSLVVKLKIPKSIRNNVARLLKTPQRRPKTVQGQSSSNSQSEIKGRDKLSPQPDALRKDKRARAESDADSRSPAVKRSKYPASLDVASKPSTPLAAPFRSPTASQHSSAQKKVPAPATSHPSEKSAIHSDPHLPAEATTPQAAARNGTPSAPDSAERPPRQSQHRAPPLTVRAREELRDLQTVHSDMGRACKRNSDTEFNEAGTSTRAPAYRRGLALAFECLLAFMLSYAIRDEMHRGRLTQLQQRSADGDLWASIFPWAARVKTFAEPYPHLKGLALQLEAVCHMAAFANACELASRETGSVSTVLKPYALATELFAEGTELLPIDALQHAFSATWRQKANVPLVRSAATQRFDPRIDGDFYLPLSAMSTTVEAVRAGRALLLEWCRANDVDWSPALGKAKSKDKDDTARHAAS